MAYLAVRAELQFYDNVPVDKLGLKTERLTNLEYLGEDMVEAGTEFGPDTPYGAALLRVGHTQQRLENTILYTLVITLRDTGLVL